MLGQVRLSANVSGGISIVVAGGVTEEELWFRRVEEEPEQKL